MNRNNVVMDKRGKLHNLREDLPEKERYITQIVTVKKANTVIMSETLVFRIETYEDEIINIHLHKEKDISILFNVFSMLEAESEEDMQVIEKLEEKRLDEINQIIKQEIENKGGQTSEK